MLEVVSTGGDTSGDAGAVAVKSASDRPAGELEELRTPRRQVKVVGFQSAARARPPKFRGCATEALAAAVQHGLRGGCWPSVRAERRLEIVSTSCDTSGDTGAVAVKSVSDRSASELKELRTPRQKVKVDGV